MPFVLDASVVACWAFLDEEHPVAELALERIRTDEARVPTLWWFEVRNILVTNERRKRITERDMATFLRGLARLRVTIDRSPDETEVLMLARRHRLSVYDASYLELARRDGISLASLDNRLVSAASAAGVNLIERAVEQENRSARGKRTEDASLFTATCDHHTLNPAGSAPPP